LAGLLIRWYRIGNIHFTLIGNIPTNCPSLLNTKDSTNNFSTCSKYLSKFLITYYVPVFQIKLVTNVQLTEEPEVNKIPYRISSNFETQ